MIAWLQQFDLVTLGLMASLVAGLSTGLGAVPVLFNRTYSQRTITALLGFGAGVMLAATSFSLLVPALEIAAARHGGAAWPAVLVAGGGTLLGACFVYVTEKLLPHEHLFKGREGLDVLQVKGAWLFAMAITLHNFPEGLAVGVSFGGGDVGNGLAVTTGIALQNMPEGLVAAVALLAVRYPVRVAFTVALVSGLVETVGGLIGILAVTLVEPLLAFGLAFAGGAMLYVVSHEVIPESHRRGFTRLASAAVMGGFVLMMGLDNLFG